MWKSPFPDKESIQQYLSHKYREVSHLVQRFIPINYLYPKELDIHPGFPLRPDFHSLESGAHYILRSTFCDDLSNSTLTTSTWKWARNYFIFKIAVMNPSIGSISCKDECVQLEFLLMGSICSSRGLYFHGSEAKDEGLDYTPASIVFNIW